MKNFECHVSGKVSEKRPFESFGRAISNCGTQTSHFRDENQGRKYATVFEFLQRPKVGSTLTVPIKNQKDTTSSMSCRVSCVVSCRVVSCVNSRWATPRLQYSAGLAWTQINQSINRTVEWFSLVIPIRQMRRFSLHSGVEKYASMYDFLFFSQKNQCVFNCGIKMKILL